MNKKRKREPNQQSKSGTNTTDDDDGDGDDDGDDGGETSTKRFKPNPKQESELDVKIREQNEEFYQLYDTIKKSPLNETLQRRFLEVNDQCAPRDKHVRLFSVKYRKTKFLMTFVRLIF